MFPEMGAHPRSDQYTFCICFHGRNRPILIEDQRSGYLLQVLLCSIPEFLKLVKDNPIFNLHSCKNLSVLHFQAVLILFLIYKVIFVILRPWPPT